MPHEVNASYGEESRPDGSDRYRTPRREVPRIGKRPEQCDAKAPIRERVQKAVAGHHEGRGRTQGDSGKAHRPGDESEKQSADGRKGERMSGSPMAKWRCVGDPETEREDIEVRKARAHDQQSDPGRDRHACRRASRSGRGKTDGDVTDAWHDRCSVEGHARKRFIALSTRADGCGMRDLQRQERTAPIRLPSKTAAALEEKIQTLLGLTLGNLRSLARLRQRPIVRRPHAIDRPLRLRHPYGQDEWRNCWSLRGATRVRDRNLRKSRSDRLETIELSRPSRDGWAG